jgi:hemerythrin superfamily protein
MENKKMKNILTLILFLILVGGCYVLFGNFSEGARAGTMIKFSKKGILIKTYEGELNLGMILNSDNGQQTSVANIWNFSVHAKDKAVINTLQEALLSGKRVKVKYHEKFVRIFIRGDTKYFVYEVEIIK